LLITPQYLVMYRVTLWALSAWPSYWNDIARRSIKPTAADKMNDDDIIIFNYDCHDITGKFNTIAVVRKIKNMYVGFYSDFDKMVSIAPTEHLIKLNSLYVLQNLLASELGIVPFVKFAKREIWKKTKDNV